MWKKRQKEKKSLTRALSQSLELPLEVLESMPELVLRGNREAVVSHCVSILEYNDQKVRIAANHVQLQFIGRNLQLTCMTDESVVITGFLLKLEFLTA